MAKYRIFGEIFEEICIFDEQQWHLWKQNPLEPNYTLRLNKHPIHSLTITLLFLNHF